MKVILEVLSNTLNLKSYFFSVALESHFDASKPITPWHCRNASHRLQRRLVHSILLFRGRKHRQIAAGAKFPPCSHSEHSACSHHRSAMSPLITTGGVRCLKRCSRFPNNCRAVHSCLQWFQSQDVGNHMAAVLLRFCRRVHTGR